MGLFFGCTMSHRDRVGRSARHFPSLLRRTCMSDQTIPRRAIAVGEIFGRLTVISEAPKRGKRRYFLCQCSCGSPVKEVRRDSIGSHTLSCGCLQKEIAIESATKTGKLNTRHGKSTTPEYQAWQNMWIRCTDPRSLDYNGYNSRTPPDEWQNFEVFLADMGSRPLSTL